jgi:UDP-glucose 4-epimerase
MRKKTVLVTGGAGYIGSHVVKQLGSRGESIVVLDNLSTGKKDAVLYGQLIEGNVGDMALVDNIMQAHEIEAVMHFAAHTIVPESVSNPLKYYSNNTANTRNLLECCQRHGVKHFIFSSTAAVYGVLESGIASESTPTQPINPYGSSKLMSEGMLRDLSFATDLTHVILRYFNVAGCDSECRIGQNTPNATLLIKVASEVAVGKRDALHIFGTDYDTPDGTGVRDFIHVEDLASAHLKALDYLRQGGQSRTFNCGYGHGYSVKEVVDAIEQALGHPIKTIEQPRRAGDPPSLIADAKAIKEVLQWQPQFDDIHKIVKTSLDWERILLARAQH